MKKKIVKNGESLFWWKSLWVGPLINYAAFPSCERNGNYKHYEKFWEKEVLHSSFFV